MKGISVELVDWMGDDLRVANTARVSFAKWKEEFDDKDARLIDYLAAHEHLSPFRHTAVSIRCTAPVFLSRQLGKHQAGFTWNEVSRRYVSVDVEHFVPDNWRGRPVDDIKQGSGNVIEKNEYVKAAYAQWIADAEEFYRQLTEDFNVAPEMARMVLPQSMQVSWIWTGNLLSFFHVYRLRSGEGAQLEAKDFAEKLKGVIQPLFPHCFEALETNAKTH